MWSTTGELLHREPLLFLGALSVWHYSCSTMLKGQKEEKFVYRLVRVLLEKKSLGHLGSKPCRDEVWPGRSHHGSLGQMESKQLTV